MRRLTYPFAALAAILSAYPVFAGERTVTLNVDNMSCASCAPVVKKSLSRVEGVTEVEVSLEKHNANVTFDDAKTRVEALIEATTNVGYPSRLAESEQASPK